MTLILKNTTLVDIYVKGRQIPASDQDDFTSEEFSNLQADALLLPAVDVGDIVVNDGISDLSAATGRRFIEKRLEALITQEGGVTTNADTNTLNFTGLAVLTDVGGGIVDVNVAGGLASLTGLTGDQIIGGDTITSESMVFVTDTTRGDKILSTEAFNFTYASNIVNNNTWMPATHVSDAVSGLILPYDATLIRATGHCVDTTSNFHNFSMWSDNVDTVTPLGLLTGGVDVSFVTSNLNIDINRGQKVRLRAKDAGGKINDTLLTLWFKWRFIP